MQTIRRNVSFLLTLICFICVVQSSYSTKPQETTDDISSDSIGLLQDSLFSKINQNFQTVKPMLEYSCYDCHSANTKEPWYYNIPGINSFVAAHVKEGREHLDFTDGFPFQNKEPLLDILHELKEEVEKGDMPLLSYRIMHWGRLIEGEQQDSLFNWIENTETVLMQFYQSHNIPYEQEDSEH